MVYIDELINCEYGAMTSEMIRDRLGVGIRNAPLSERIQLDPKLTLKTAKKWFARKRQWRNSNTY